MLTLTFDGMQFKNMADKLGKRLADALTQAVVKPFTFEFQVLRPTELRSAFPGQYRGPFVLMVYTKREGLGFAVSDLDMLEKQFDLLRQLAASTTGCEGTIELSRANGRVSARISP